MKRRISTKKRRPRGEETGGRSRRYLLDIEPHRADPSYDYIARYKSYVRGKGLTMRGFIIFLARYEWHMGRQSAKKVLHKLIQEVRASSVMGNKIQYRRVEQIAVWRLEKS